MIIESVKKACQIISCFSNEEPVLGVGEIADKLNMNISTAHHLATTLCHEGVLIKDKLPRQMFRLSIFIKRENLGWRHWAF